MASMISEHESFQGVDGKPIVNGYIYVGAAGQDPKLNPIVIYSDRELTTPIANPQRTDSYGRAQNKIWVTDRYSLKVEDKDNIQKFQDLQRGELADSPTINLINVQGINDVTADAVPPVSAYVDKAVYVLTVVNSNTGAVTLDFGGGATSVIKNNADALVAGDWPAGSIQRVTYNAFSSRFDTLTFSAVETTAQINAINAELTSRAAKSQSVWNDGESTVEGIISPEKLDAKIKTLALGEGQTWQSLLASRSAGVTYTNTTGRAIYLSIRVSVHLFSLQISGITVYGHSGNASGQGTLVGIVPDGETYEVIQPGTGTITNWLELR